MASGDEFWELHRRLGEQHEAVVKSLTQGGGPPLPICEMKSPPEEELICLEDEAVPKRKNSTVSASLSDMDHSKVRPCWRWDLSQSRSGTRRHSATTRNLTAVTTSRTAANNRGQDDWKSVEGIAMTARKFQHPGSFFRVWWGTCGMLLLGFDMVTIPLRFFGLADSLGMEVMSWCIRLYWTVDIGLSFVTGYYDKGLLVLEWRKTVRNYLTKWFLFDLVVVSMDWGTKIAEGNEQDLPRLSRTLRGTRVLRLVRLSRLLKVGNLTESIQEQLSAQGSIHYGIIRIVMWLLVTSHLVACFWFAIGSMDDGPSWVTVTAIQDRSAAFQYATSLHWAVAQLGVGQTDLEPVNFWEKVFAIGVMFAALLTFSTLLSSMSALLGNLSKQKSYELSEFKALRRFLEENQIDQDLSHRITRFLQHRMALMNTMEAADRSPAILGLLSTQLTGELQVQRYKDLLNPWDFTDAMREGGYHSLREMQLVATRCMVPHVLAPGDVVFAADAEAGAMYFLVKGSFSYSTEMSVRKLCRARLAEMCLWTTWQHLGDLVAEDSAYSVQLSMESFCATVGQTSETKPIAWGHAMQCVQMLVEHGALSDLWEDYPSKEEERSGSKQPPKFGRILPWADELQ